MDLPLLASVRPLLSIKPKDHEPHTPISSSNTRHPHLDSLGFSVLLDPSFIMPNNHPPTFLGAQQDQPPLGKRQHDHPGSGSGSSVRGVAYQVFKTDWNASYLYPADRIAPHNKQINSCPATFIYEACLRVSWSGWYLILFSFPFQVTPLVRPFVALLTL